MIAFYIIALIPAIIGTILYILNKKINVWEWLLGTAIAFLTSAIMHGVAIYSMTKDIETLSGQITSVSHFPAWEGRYTETYTETDSKGNTTTHTRTCYESHTEHWSAFLNFGIISEEKDISKEFYEEAKNKFGGKEEKNGHQNCWHNCSCIGGDDHIYVTMNETGYIYPVTTTHYFQNKIKAAPTLFSFIKVPANIPVYEWPENPNWLKSDRLLGVKGINEREWDLMNSRLGPKKLVNVIMIGFNSADSMLGKYQQAKWIGGRKNDLVITYGFQGNEVLWSFCFGFTEKEICKRNIESIVMSNPINDSIIPLIETEIKASYVKKDWKKFDYVTIEPPKWAYWTLIIIMLITQTGFYIWANCNEFNKSMFLG